MIYTRKELRLEILTSGGFVWLRKPKKAFLKPVL